MRAGFALIIFAVCLPISIADAQKGSDDGPVGIFSNRSEYNQFMGSVKNAAYGEGGSPELRAMVPMLNDMVLGQEFGTTANRYGGANNSEFDLLADPKVRENIDMVDEQYEELQKLNAEVQSRMADRIRNLNFSDRDGLVDQLKEIRDEARKELETLFIPEQLERLEQIRNQSQLRGRSLVDLLTSDPLRSKLEISSRQTDELREVEREIEKEIEEEIAKLRERARKRLLSKLDQDQQDQVEKIFGDTFQFAEPAKKGRRAKK